MGAKEEFDKSMGKLQGQLSKFSDIAKEVLAGYTAVAKKPVKIKGRNASASINEKGQVMITFESADQGQEFYKELE